MTALEITLPSPMMRVTLVSLQMGLFSLYRTWWAVRPEEQPARLEKLKKHYFGSYYLLQATLTTHSYEITFCLW